MKTLSPAVPTIARLLACGTLFAAALAPVVDGAATELPTEFDDGVIMFGGDASHPPFKWRSGGKVVGINVDLQNAIAEVGGVHAEHWLGDWPEAIRGLESGDVDAVAMFKSASREQRFRFTRTFEIVSHAIYGRNDSENVSSIVDLSGSRVVVEAQSFAHDRLANVGIAFEVVLAPNTAAAVEAVLAGRADYALLAEPAAEFLIRSRKLPLRAAGAPLWPAEYALAVRKDRIELASWLDEMLGIVISSGRYQEIQARREDRVTTLGENTPRWHQYLLWPLLGLLLLGAWWLRSLRRTLVSQEVSLVEESRHRQEAEARFQWAADHFTDTNMPRQHHFMMLANQVLERSHDGRRKELVVVRPADLDRTIRTMGHEAAFEAMRTFARQLQIMRFPACGQLGRKTFVVFGDKEDIDKKLRPSQLAGETVVMNFPHLRIHAGAATWPQHGENLTELLRKAESALARAIERRVSWIDFRPFMEPDSDSIRLVSLFRRKRSDVIYPVFQPQLDLATGRIAGAEALARWQDPATGEVSPGTFIPLLEDAGLVKHVTRHMLSEAIRVSAEMRRIGFPCPISVNVTGNDLLGWRLSGRIISALDEHDGRPADIQLELTETSVVDRPELLQWKMRKLVRAGINFSVDDFGTGHSSLSYLSAFPVREIKIDQSFVRDMARQEKNMSIVTSTIQMGHVLDMTVVAEGVETEESLNVLRRHGCDRAQGYVISRPLSEADFVEFVKSKGNFVDPRQRGSKVTAFRGAR